MRFIDLLCVMLSIVYTVAITILCFVFIFHPLCIQKFIILLILIFSLGSYLILVKKWNYMKSFGILKESVVGLYVYIMSLLSKLLNKKQKKIILDLSATFSLPDDTWRTFLISNIGPNVSGESLGKFLLANINKSVNDVQLKILLYTTKKCCGIRTATVTIPFTSCTSPGPVYSGFLQQNNKEFEGKKVVIKEIQNRKEVVSKHRKWRFKDGVYKCETKQNNWDLQALWTGYPDKTYTSIDAGFMLLCKNDVDVIDRSVACGVEKIVMRTISLKESYMACKLAKLYPDYLYFTVGVRYDRAKHWTEETLTSLEKLAANPQCVAIGECGLDCQFSADNEEVKAKKINIFKAQIDLACRLRKPLYLVVLPADGDVVLEILGEYQQRLPKVLISSTMFQNTKIMKKFVEMGFYFGIMGEIFAKDFLIHKKKLVLDGTIPMSKLILQSYTDISEKTDLKKMMLEAVLSGTTNLTQQSIKYYNSTYENEYEPCDIPIHIEIISDHLKCHPKVMAKILLDNARQLFNFTECNME